MTASLSLHAQNGSPALDPARLAAANINPKTGLASDYLNHFNEAIMLLDLLPTTPECIVELIGWEPLSYEEHFAASHFKGKELAIAAYGMAEPAARAQLDELADTMNALLVATCETFQKRASLDAANALAAANRGTAEAAGRARRRSDQRLRPRAFRRHDHRRAAGDGGRAVREIDLMLRSGRRPRLEAWPTLRVCCHPSRHGATHRSSG